MGLKRIIQANASGPNGVISFDTSIVPLWARMFGGETSLAQLMQNMAPNGAPASIIGTPVLNAEYVTLGDGNGLVLPYLGSLAFTAFIIAQCSGLSSTSLAKLLGNHSSVINAGIKFELRSTQLYSYAGNTYGNMGTVQIYVGGAPEAWKMYEINVQPNAGRASPNPYISIGEVTENPALMIASHPQADLTRNMNPVPLQLGTYADAHSATKTALLNVVGAAVFPLLSEADEVIARKQFKMLAATYNGVYV